MDELLSALLKSMTNDFGVFLTDAFRGIIGGPLRQIANKKLAGLFPNDNKCTPLPMPQPNKYVDFQTSAIVKILTKVVNGVTPNHEYDINLLIDALTSKLGHKGGIVVPGELFSIHMDIPGRGNLSLDARDLEIDGLDTFYNIAALVCVCVRVCERVCDMHVYHVVCIGTTRTRRALL